MHDSSFVNMTRFISKYRAEIGVLPGSVLDVGSQDFNGTYRPLFPGWKYTGLDTSPGKNVDLVVKNPYVWEEIYNCSYDLVISGQVFEHMEFPWLTIREIARVLKPGGLCCIIAPSAGPRHWNTDCWRFFPDGLSALAKWAQFEVLESYISWDAIKNEIDDQWKDAVLICRRSK
jgi:SAM-dependent methyltransferase